MLNIGTCGLHTAHGSMKTGEKASWSVRKILKAMDGILQDSPARRETFEKVTETNEYPLPYCGHRWCENENCLQRADKYGLHSSSLLNIWKNFPSQNNLVMEKGSFSFC